MFFKLFVCLLGCGFCCASLATLPSDLKWTNAINAKLCESGTHSDAVAAQFFACYDESVTPGGKQFIACMNSVYGVSMDTEANIDVVCSGSPEKLRKYEACVLRRLVFPGKVCPSNAIHALNQCQGGVLGVPAPA